MATLSDLIVKLGIDATAFTGNLDTAMGKLDSFGSSALKVGGVLSAAITVPLTALGVGALDAAVQLESLRNGLIAITGSAQEADTQLTALKEVAKLPGLGFQEAVQGAINLQAVGFSAKESQEILTVFGNALASVGRGREDLNEVIRQLGQLASRGTVTADNLKPLIERVPQLATVMKDLWGTIDTEALKKMGVDSQTFVSMVITELGKLPPVTGGLKNDLENLKDTTTFALGEIGAAIAPLVTAFVSVAVPAIQSVSAAFSSLDPTLQTVIVVAGGLAAALGPLLLLLGGMASGLSAILGVVGGGAGLTAALGVLWPIVAGIAAAWATWELAKWLSGFAPVKAAIDFLVGGLEKLWEWILKIPGAKALVDKAGEAFDSLKGKVSDLTKGTGKAEDAAKDHEKQLKSLAVGTSSAVGKATKSFDGMTDSVKLLTVKHDAQKDALFKLSIETIKAREATEDWNRGLIAIKGTTTDYIREAEDMVDRIGDIERATMDLSKATGSMTAAMRSAMGEMAPAVDELGEAFKRLGITTSTSIQKSAALAQKDYERIRDSGVATVREITEAWLASERAQIQASRDKGEAIDTEYEKVLDEVEASIKGTTETTKTETEKQKTLWGSLGNQVSTIFTDLSKGISDVIFEGKSIGEMFKGVFEEAGKAVLRFVIEYIEGKLFAALGKLLDDILPAVSGKLSDVFGSGGGGGGGGIPTGGGTPTPAPDEGGGGGGVPGGSGGGGMQDPLAWVNAAANVVNAIYSVRQEGTLNAIEENTRFGMIHQLALLLQANEYWPVLKMIYSGIETFVNTQAFRLHDIANYLQNIVEQHIFRLQDINDAAWDTVALIRDVTNVHLAAIRESVAVLPRLAVAGAGGSQPIVIQNILDGRIISETVIDNMGRQLNQSGQILR